MSKNNLVSENLKSIMKKLFIKDKNNIEYKYDNIIENKIIKINNTHENYNIGNFKVKRKIPDKKDLSKIYDKFIKNKPNIISNNDNKIFNYIYTIDKLLLENDNKYILFNLNLNQNKKYILSFKCYIQEKCNIILIFNNNIKQDIYKIRGNINENILFNTNKLNLVNNNIEFYIILKNDKEINIKDIILEIKEIKNKYDENITLFKNKKKQIIF